MAVGVVLLCLLATATVTVTSHEVTMPLLKELHQVTIRVDNFNQHTVYSVLRHGEVVQSVRLDDEFGRNMSLIDAPNGFTLRGVGQTIQFELLENRADITLVKVSRMLNSDQCVSDCISLDTGRLHWYGGPQIFHQYWPIEKLSLANYSYVAKQQDNVGVAERYWLNSMGSFVFVDETTPLFINQNVGDRNTLCLTVQNSLPYNVRRASIPFVYYIGVGVDAKQAHKGAVKNFLKKPTGVPDDRMIQHPIWSTWARYEGSVLLDEKGLHFNFIFDLKVQS